MSITTWWVVMPYIKHFALLFCQMNLPHVFQEQFSEVLDGMFEVLVKPQEHIINQGDDGDNFYVIEKWEISQDIVSTVFKLGCLMLCRTDNDLLTPLLLPTFPGVCTIFLCRRTEWTCALESMTTRGVSVSWLWCTTRHELQRSSQRRKAPCGAWWVQSICNQIHWRSKFPLNVL